MKNGLVGIFSKKKSLTNFPLGGGFLKMFSRISRILSRKIIEKRFLLKNKSKTHFSRIFLDIFLRFLKNFHHPQAGDEWEFFFSKKMPPRSFFKKALLQTTPPDHLSRKSSSRHTRCPDHFSRKVLLLHTVPPAPSTPPPPKGFEGSRGGKGGMEGLQEPSAGSEKWKGWGSKGEGRDPRMK